MVQYAIDFNYSSVLNYDENSFANAEIGAVRGIAFQISGGIHSRVELNTPGPF